MPRSSLRLTRAYTTTIRVLSGYLWLRIWRPVLGPGLYAAKLSALHRKNAKRVELTILALGRQEVSASEYIAEIQWRLATQDRVNYRMHF